jgi:hypothetical protein
MKTCLFTYAILIVFLSLFSCLYYNAGMSVNLLVSFSSCMGNLFMGLEINVFLIFQVVEDVSDVVDCFLYFFVLIFQVL